MKNCGLDITSKPSTKNRFFSEKNKLVQRSQVETPSSRTMKVCVNCLMYIPDHRKKNYCSIALRAFAIFILRCKNRWKIGQKLGISGKVKKRFLRKNHCFNIFGMKKYVFYDKLVSPPCAWYPAFLKKGIFSILLIHFFWPTYHQFLQLKI